MTTCPNCKKQLENDAKFCDVCGTKIEKTMFCPSCGKQSSMEFNYCQSCGASLLKSKASENDGMKKKQKIKLSPKTVKIGCACIAVVLVVVLALSLIGNIIGGNDFALYLKDGELFYNNLSKFEPWQVTKRLVNGEESFDNEDFSEIAYKLGYYTHLSDDGNMLFYVDKVDEDSENFSLFCRHVKKTKEEPIKIDSDVRLYSVSDSGKCVTYLKGEDGLLYQHNLVDKEKVDESVSKFEVSDDGKTIIYLDTEGNLYLKSDGKNKEKIDSDVKSISDINDKFNTIYYVKEDALYKKIEGQEKVMISNDISFVIGVYESGEIYYTKDNSVESSVLDYVEDDMRETDLMMAEPICPEYPWSWSYDSDEEYEAAYEQYEKAYEKYELECDVYNEKENRDELRKELAEETMTISTDILCYFDGKKEVILADSCDDIYSSNAALNRSVIVYSKHPQTIDKKVKLSEIEDVYQVNSLIEKAFESSAETCVAVKGKETSVAQMGARNVDINSAGDTVYFCGNVDESQHGDLYKINISGDKVKKAELYDTEVCEYSAYFVTEDQYAYSKDVKDYKGELYINKERIDYDVNIFDWTYFNETDSIVYLVDWNDDKHHGTLKLYHNGKSVKIADDIFSYNVTPNDEIIYLCNYSTKHYKGELFIYKNGKSQKVDDDVIAIIPIYKGKYKGNIYYNY